MTSRSLIFKATSDNHSPVDGVVLRNLANNTRQGVEECVIMKQLLEKRIKKTSPDIKYKALRTVVYLSENGAVEFRMQWQRDNSVLREHTMFRGKTDPVRGEIPNERVREEAKKAMKAIFSTSITKPKSTISSDKITGFGSKVQQIEEKKSATSSFASLASAVTSTISAYSGRLRGPDSKAPAAPKSSKYGGVGSDGTYIPSSTVGLAKSGTIFESSTNSKSSGVGQVWRCVVKNGVNVRLKPTVTAAKAGVNLKNGEQVTVLDEVLGREHWIKHTRGWSCAKTPEKVLMQPISGSYSAPVPIEVIKSTPTFENTSNPYPDLDNPYPDSGDVPVREAETSATAVQDVQAGTASEYERKLVKQICNPTGISMAPRRDELKQFINRCHSLNTMTVCSLLDEMLANGPTKSKGKALHIIQAMYDTYGENVIRFFQANSANLKVLSGSTMGSLRNKAQNLLVTFKLVEQRIRSAPVQPQVQAPQPKPKQNLFEVEEDEAPAVAVKTTTTNVLSGLFEDDTPAPTEAPKEASSSAFGFLEDGGDSTNEVNGGNAEENSAFNFLGESSEKSSAQVTAPKEEKSAFSFMGESTGKAAANTGSNVDTTVAMMTGIGTLEIDEPKKAEKLDPVESLLLTSKRQYPTQQPQQAYYQRPQYSQGYNQGGAYYNQQQMQYQQRQQHQHQGYGYPNTASSNPTQSNTSSDYFFGTMQVPEKKQTQSNVSMDMFTSPTLAPQGGVTPSGFGDLMGSTSVQVESKATKKKPKKKKEDDSFAFVGDLLK